MLLTLCDLLRIYVDVYFENVCFAHRALTRPLGTTTTTTTIATTTTTTTKY